MLTLYYNPRSRASIAKWMLEECGAEYSLKTIDFQAGDNKTTEFLALNPSGKLPVLVDGEQVIFENGAIALYLGERFADSGMAPAPESPLRGKYLTFMVYANSQLEPAMGDSLFNIEHMPARGWTDFSRAQEVVAQAIGDGPYLLGDTLSLADIVVGANFIWRRAFGAKDEHPVIKAYTDRLLERPGAQEMVRHFQQ